MCFEVMKPLKLIHRLKEIKYKKKENKFSSNGENPDKEK